MTPHQPPNRVRSALAGPLPFAPRLMSNLRADYGPDAGGASANDATAVGWSPAGEKSETTRKGFTEPR